MKGTWLVGLHPGGVRFDIKRIGGDVPLPLGQLHVERRSKRSQTIRTSLAAFGLLLASLAPTPAATPGGIGDQCGGIGHVPCAAGLWCEPPSGACGQPDLIGACVDIHRYCHHNYHAVCGCDGVTYGNECAREHESVPQAHAGKC